MLRLAASSALPAVILAFAGPRRALQKTLDKCSLFVLYTAVTGRIAPAAKPLPAGSGFFVAASDAEDKK